MPFDDHAVFLSSRFAEFAPLRRALRPHFAAPDRRLRVALIDTDDGAATHRPPLADSLARLRQARFMILLLGEEYGEAVEGHAKSYVNLEYDAALETEGDIRVLAFGIGRSYAHGRIVYSGDPRLAAFQRQVESNHTLVYFDGSESVEDQAEAIFQQLVYEVCDLRNDPPQIDGDDIDDGIEPQDLIESEEVESLEQRYGNAAADSPSNRRSAADALAQPAELAAREQCREADTAIRLGALRIAREHLLRAVNHRPLDLEANYRLARLYIATRQRRYLDDALERLDLVRRICERDRQQYRVCDCLLLRAKALIRRGDTNEALVVAERACAEAPGYGRARYEYACLLLFAGRTDAACGELLKAVKCYFPLWPQAQRDPRFADIISHTDADVARWLRSHREMTREVLAAESSIAAAVGDPAPPPVALKEIRNPNALGRLSRASIFRQHGTVKSTYLRVVSAKSASDENLDGSAAKIKLAEQQELQKRREPIEEALAAARRSVFVARVLAAIAAAIVLGVLLAWMLALPTAYAVLALFTASVTAIPLAGGLSMYSVREQEKALADIDGRLQQVAAARRQLTDDAQAMRQLFERVLAAWRGSLAREGRHQPYPKISNGAASGELLVANRKEIDDLQRDSGVEVVVQNVIEIARGGAAENDRRLYRVVASSRDRLVLSEADVYAG